jgi:hypothetical protein
MEGDLDGESACVDDAGRAPERRGSPGLPLIERKARLKMFERKSAATN